MAPADALVQHAPMVRGLAYQMLAKLSANVEVDDLIQAGTIALWDALDRFDAAQGVQFNTFAAHRIRGAMKDEMRRYDWLSRRDRRRLRDAEAAMRRLKQQCDSPRESDVSRELGMTLVAYQALRTRCTDALLCHIDNIAVWDDDGPIGLLEAVESPGADPLDILLSAEADAALDDAIDALPLRYLLLFGRVSKGDLKQDIAVDLGVTPSRVSQLLATAIWRLKRAVLGKQPAAVPAPPRGRKRTPPAALDDAAWAAANIRGACAVQPT